MNSVYCQYRMVTALTADSADRFCFSLVSLDRRPAKFQNGDRGAALPVCRQIVRASESREMWGKATKS